MAQWQSAVSQCGTMAQRNSRHAGGTWILCIGGTVASESALRSAGTLLSWVRASPPAPWPDGGPESLRSPCYIYKNQTLKDPGPGVWIIGILHQQKLYDLLIDLQLATCLIRTGHVTHLGMIKE
ncbi:hypothetical protein PoB_002434200 [Plakobranchus ocellatus]|uniref:Uncharacterized protein n=1 Tax=Plakobranchus ocellatus TaxID=259542 RepID=A0AAV3ZTF3_9GAST|nr:hypothetical protein PoB_002434200 [Plakobranchus ocellatus]